jgi:hypothetical protein
VSSVHAGCQIPSSGRHAQASHAGEYRKDPVKGLERFKCHQFMLAARSPVLAAMLKHPMQVNTVNSVLYLYLHTVPCRVVIVKIAAKSYAQIKDISRKRAFSIVFKSVLRIMN